MTEGIDLNGVPQHPTPAEEQLALSRKLSLQPIAEDTEVAVLLTMSPTKGLNISGCISDRIKCKGMLGYAYENFLPMIWAQQDMALAQQQAQSRQLQAQILGQSRGRMG